MGEEMSEQEKSLRDCFAKFDANGDGKIQEGEFKRLMSSGEFSFFLTLPAVNGSRDIAPFRRNERWEKKCRSRRSLSETASQSLMPTVMGRSRRASSKG
mmetsp:Transcript_50460/g.110036  ORF Transcript_50460/g.110036 Transcript_50460/m.110036 type:complete len:99 (-) Transcript_50460:13-309(-)